jgi:hypothetical protein
LHPFAENFPGLSLSSDTAQEQHFNRASTLLPPTQACRKHASIVENEEAVRREEMQQI